MKRLTAEQHLALRAFEQGYHCGADPQRERRRHIVDPATHQHWRAGYRLSRADAARASDNYRDRLLSGRDVEADGGQELTAGDS